MERTVPLVASEKIELYLRTYYSLLRASTEVKIHSLVETHADTNSLLHSMARQPNPDMSAFIYCQLRLPPVMRHVELVVMGQSFEMFAQSGIGDLNHWQQIEAPARRRRTFFDGKDRLAVLISSRSDIDDLIPILTAYQIEWNKLHRLMELVPDDFPFDRVAVDSEVFSQLAANLQLSGDDLQKLYTIWGEDFGNNMLDIAAHERDMRVQLLNGSLTEYRRAINAWWERIENSQLDISKRPVYFVSSNAHSLVNIVTGFALNQEKEMVRYLEHTDDELLKQEWVDIQAKVVPSSRENFFYYLMKKYMQTDQGKDMVKKRHEIESACKIKRISSAQSFDIEAQVIPLNGIDSSSMDPRLHMDNEDFLQRSDALILNIDYPLGFAAYQVLSEVAEHAGRVLGVYIMGKSATLNGAVGDVIIPDVVYDGHSHNTYLYPNCFSAQDVTPYLVYGTVLDSQKAVSVLGTFLQNHEYMDVFYREGYTDIEMEAGPYLSAVYEMVRPKRHPVDEIVNLYNQEIDLGVLHYASDKPLSKGRNLGAAHLSYFGMDPTYAATVAILKRIFEREMNRSK
jgi:hypothetical protein